MNADLSIYSDVLGKNVSVRVLYPHRCASYAYEDENSAEAPYRVLYLLHGLGDDYTFWSKRTCIESYAEGRNLVVVMPDGDVSWYCDMYRGRKYFTYLTDELPGQIKGIFRNISDRREDTFIGGASMGGYGAVRAAMSFPEKYAKAFSFSGALDIEALLPWIERGILENAMGPVEQALAGAENPYVLAESLRASGKISPELYLWCGYKDFLYEANVNFKEHLEKLGLPLEYHEGEGEHTWPCWEGQLPKVLNWLLSDR